MTLYNWLCIFGIVGIPAAVLKFCFGQIKGVRLGVQALLRAQMIADYNHYTAKGYAPIYAKDNFENCWKQYHSLGANGVMDNVHMNFLALPDEAPRKAGV